MLGVTKLCLVSGLDLDSELTADSVLEPTVVQIDGIYHVKTCPHVYTVARPTRPTSARLYYQHEIIISKHKYIHTSLISPPVGEPKTVLIIEVVWLVRSLNFVTEIKHLGPADDLLM